MPTRRQWHSACLLTLAACGSDTTPIQSKEFEIRAINVDGEPIPCLVVVDGKWPMENDKPAYTDCRVVIAFPREDVELLVKPARLTSDGRILRVPSWSDPEEYRKDSRKIRVGDPELQLFILERDPIR